MPRWASRLTLEVTGVRVERLNDISEADAKAEGVLPTDAMPNMHPGRWANYLRTKRHGGIDRTGAWDAARRSYQSLWESLGGSWALNPWVWVVSFRRLP